MTDTRTLSKQEVWFMNDYIHQPAHAAVEAALAEKVTGTELLPEALTENELWYIENCVHKPAYAAVEDALAKELQAADAIDAACEQTLKTVTNDPPRGRFEDGVAGAVARARELQQQLEQEQRL